jgi:hypothetical protein
VEDEAAAEPEWEVPPGAPIRMYEWLVPPLVLIGLAVIEIFAPTSVGSRSLPGFSIVAASLLIIAAASLWIFGYCAYRDLTVQTVERYVVAGVIALFVTGALLSLVTLGPGWACLYTHLRAHET